MVVTEQERKSAANVRVCVIATFQTRSRTGIFRVIKVNGRGSGRLSGGSGWPVLCEIQSGPLTHARRVLTLSPTVTTDHRTTTSSDVYINITLYRVLGSGYRIAFLLVFNVESALIHFCELRIESGHVCLCVRTPMIEESIRTLLKLKREDLIATIPLYPIARMQVIEHVKVAPPDIMLPRAEAGATCPANRSHNGPLPCQFGAVAKADIKITFSMQLSNGLPNYHN
ncbi:hypothetical protein J6590_044342 [Homalodisca vitripennis]|nr:hypothetical protein J6590_044342 [Homalodisca vitripennis]